MQQLCCHSLAELLLLVSCIITGCYDGGGHTAIWHASVILFKQLLSLSCCGQPQGHL